MFGYRNLSELTPICLLAFSYIFLGCNPLIHLCIPKGQHYANMGHGFSKHFTEDMNALWH